MKDGKSRQTVNFFVCWYNKICVRRGEVRLRNHRKKTKWKRKEREVAKASTELLIRKKVSVLRTLCYGKTIFIIIGFAWIHTLSVSSWINFPFDGEIQAPHAAIHSQTHSNSIPLDKCILYFMPLLLKKWKMNETICERNNFFNRNYTMHGTSTVCDGEHLSIWTFLPRRRHTIKCMGFTEKRINSYTLITFKQTVLYRFECLLTKQQQQQQHHRPKYTLIVLNKRKLNFPSMAYNEKWSGILRENEFSRPQTTTKHKQQMLLNWLEYSIQWIFAAFQS